MAKEIKTVFVLVHPFCGVYSPERRFKAPFMRPGNLDTSTISLRPEAIRLAQGNEVALACLRRFEAMRRFYKGQIDRVKKTPGAALVFVKYVDQLKSLKLKHLKGLGVHEKVAENIITYLDNYQADLGNHAKRLGKKLFEFNEVDYDKSLFDVAGVFEKEALRRKLSLKRGLKGPYRAPVHLFGEFGDACVTYACAGFKDRGFNAQVLESKSVY